MGEFVTSLGHALCTTVMTGGNASPCYNASAMHNLGTASLFAVILVAVGYRALSRF